MDTPPRRRRDRRTQPQTGTQLSDRNKKLFELLDPHFAFKFLTSKWVHEFIAGNEDASKRLLRRLFDAGYLDRPHQQRWSPNSIYKHLVYQRADKAARAVDATSHAAHRSHSYPHELLVDLGFYAPMRYAVAQEKALKLYTAKDLLSGASFRIKTANGTERVTVPNPTRFNPDPFLVTIRDKETMRLDGTPFMLERTMRDGTTSLIFVPGIEVDRQTESLRNIKPKDPTRTTLTKHLEQIMDFFGRRIFIKHYGFPMMMVPIITTNETHTRNAMAFVEEQIGACRYMLFKTLPDLAAQPHFPMPSGEFFTSPWIRVGFPPFTFDEHGFS